MTNTLTISNKWQTVLIDITVLVLVYFIPAFVHATAFPLYYFEPMRLLLFGAYLLSRDHKNAYLLALTLPLVSTIFPPHHPPFYKAVIMSVELFVNIACFHWLSGKLSWQAGILIFISTVASKIVYYGLKFLFINLTLIDGTLITTGLWLQLGTLAVLSVLFALFFKRPGK